MKGWYGNKQKHSMASRGIRSGEFDSKQKAFTLHQYLDMLNNNPEEINWDEVDEIYESYGIHSENIFVYISDASHGWLKVPIKLVKELGLMGDITQFSYRRGEYAYLEEDVDAMMFINAFKERFDKDVEFIEVQDTDESKIRDFRRMK